MMKRNGGVAAKGMEEEEKEKKKKQQQQQNGGTSISIPVEVVMNIWSRLPVKTLSRFRCVSKEWNGYLSPSNKYFINLHNHHHLTMKKKPFLLIWEAHKQDDNERFALDFCPVGLADGRLHDKFRAVLDNTWYHISMEASCRNLVLLKGLHMHILNPSTREITRLPKSTHERKLVMGTRGFGYLPSLDQYTVVQWFASADPNRRRCEIFTFADGGEGVQSFDSWREVEYCFPSSLIFKSNCACVDGVIYWLLWGENRGGMLCFDLQGKRFETAYCPEVLPAFSSQELVELKGFLCLVGISTSSQSSTLNLWIRKKDQDEPHTYKWFKELCVDVPLHTGCKTVTYIPGDDSRGEELLIGSIGQGLFSIKEGFLYYNTANKSVRKADDLHMHFRRPTEQGRSCIYYDSFFSLTSSL